MGINDFRFDILHMTFFSSSVSILSHSHTHIQILNASAHTLINFYPILVTAFVVSAIVSHQHKCDMVHIQNSTLAGGVAVGSVCNLLVSPHGALLIGTISAIISVFGYRYLTVG